MTAKRRALVAEAREAFRTDPEYLIRVLKDGRRAWEVRTEPAEPPRPRPYVPPSTPVWDQIMSKVVEIDGCWAWTGALSNGYPAIRIRGRVVHVRRWVFGQVRGGTPPNIYRDPGCNGLCVNPSHLLRHNPARVAQIIGRRP